MIFTFFFLPGLVIMDILNNYFLLIWTRINRDTNELISFGPKLKKNFFVVCFAQTIGSNARNFSMAYTMKAAILCEMKSHD